MKRTVIFLLLAHLSILNTSAQECDNDSFWLFDLLGLVGDILSDIDSESEDSKEIKGSEESTETLIRTESQGISYGLNMINTYGVSENLFNPLGFNFAIIFTMPNQQKFSVGLNANFNFTGFQNEVVSYDGYDEISVTHMINNYQILGRYRIYGSDHVALYGGAKFGLSSFFTEFTGKREDPCSCNKISETVERYSNMSGHLGAFIGIEFPFRNNTYDRFFFNSSFLNIFPTEHVDKESVRITDHTIDYMVQQSPKQLIGFQLGFIHYF